MYQMYPIYMPSAEYAHEHNEIDLWRESHKINRECRDFINEKASMSYHERKLPEFLKELTDTFGLERSMFVVARTIRGADWDGRYFREVKDRAAGVDFQDMETAEKLSQDGKDPYRAAEKTITLISHIHPVMLNAIFRNLMKMEQEQINLSTEDIAPDNELSEGFDR